MKKRKVLRLGHRVGLTRWVLLVGLLGNCQSHHQAETHNPADSTAHPSPLSGPAARLEKAVLATHDSVMNQMGHLVQLQREVTTRLEGADEPTKKRGLQISLQLRRADDAMMDWMNQYNGDTLRQLDQQQAVDYLKSQQQKVNAMSQQMRQSMTDAREYLKK
jgi:hypothetical protein